MQCSPIDIRHSRPPSQKVVLALHGSASSGRQWQALAKRLQGTAHVIAPDLPGYGTSATDTGERFAAPARIIEQRAEPLHFIAHSFGGAVALRLAHAYPNRVASVTLYDPIAAGPDATGRHPLPGALDTIWRRYADAPPPELMSRFYDFWATGRSWADLTPDQQERLLRDHAGLCRDMTEIKSGRWTVSKHAFGGPITIFRGQLSPEVTAAMAHRIARTHHQVSVIALPGMGHFAPLAQTDALNAHLVPAILNACAPEPSHATACKDLQQTKIFPTPGANEAPHVA